MFKMAVKIIKIADKLLTKCDGYQKGKCKYMKKKEKKSNTICKTSVLSFLFFSNTLIFLSFFIYLLTDTVNIDQIERLLVLSVLHRLISSSIYPQSCKLPQKGVLYRREYRTPIFVNNNTIHSKQIYRRHEEELAGVLWYTLSLTVKIQNAY